MMKDLWTWVTCEVWAWMIYEVWTICEHKWFVRLEHKWFMKLEWPMKLRWIVCILSPMNNKWFGFFEWWMICEQQMIHEGQVTSNVHSMNDLCILPFICFFMMFLHLLILDFLKFKPNFPIPNTQVQVDFGFSVLQFLNTNSEEPLSPTLTWSWSCVTFPR